MKFSRDPSVLASAPPLQTRSRASTDRMVAVAVDLYVSGGYEAVTASAVTREAGVAVGTIYGRFGNKDGLVAAVEVVLLERFDTDVRQTFDPKLFILMDKSSVITAVVRALAELLCAHASQLRPIMRHAGFDEDTARRGSESYERLRSAFVEVAVLNVASPGIGDVEAACDSCFGVAYATFARALGLGSSPDAMNEAGLLKLMQDVAEMCDAFLIRRFPSMADRGN